ncbi:hypothetical protein [Bacillus sp. NEAU-Y102]
MERLDVGIFKIAHFYSNNHDESSFFVKTNIATETLGEIIACLQFRFEDLVDESLCMEDGHMLALLTEFFDVEDVTEEYKKYLPDIQLDTAKWRDVNVIAIPKTNEIITQIDQYHVREKHCGSNYKELVKKRLPNCKEFDKAITDSKYKYEY